MIPENMVEALKLVKLKKNPDFYFGELLFGLTHNEERKILPILSEKEQEIAWKSLTLLPREATRSMVDFAQSQNIMDVFSDKYITVDDAFGKLEADGYVLDSITKKNMVVDLLDLLSESNILDKKMGKNPMFKESKKRPLDTSLESEEIEFIKEHFSGSTNFFDICTKYSGRFLRGERNFINFGEDTGEIWENYLGSSEWNAGRKFAMASMKIKNDPEYKILNLCYGLGYEIEALLTNYPKIKIYALDFVDAHLPRIKKKINQLNEKIGSPQEVEFVESKKWKEGKKSGFGATLPFPENYFDGVILTFSDPFIPIESRFKTYNEIYRVLKPNGTLGMLSWQYPDLDRVYYKDNWIRRSIYRHNFAESVVEGWSGFHDISKTLNMFNEIGFHYGGFSTKSYHLFDGIFWRMRK